MKSFFSLILVVAMGLAFPITAIAENIKVMVNNESTVAIVEEGHTLVPMRPILEALGADVRWSPDTNTAIGTREGVELQLPIGSTHPTVNGRSVFAGVPIKLLDGMTYMPLHLVAQSFEEELTWDDKTQTVTISCHEKEHEKKEQFVNEEPFKTEANNTVYEQKGQASWYGAKFHGRKTSSGEIFNMNKNTAAHRTLPFGTEVKVTFLKTGKSVLVKINDRGPHIANRIIDLSKNAADCLGLTSYGCGEVTISMAGK